MDGVKDLLSILQEMDKKLNKVEKDSATLLDHMGKMRVDITNTNDKLEEVTIRLDRMDGRMESMENRMEGMENRMERVENRMERVESSIADIVSNGEHHFETIHTSLEEMKASFSKRTGVLNDRLFVVEEKVYEHGHDSEEQK